MEAYGKFGNIVPSYLFVGLLPTAKNLTHIKLMSETLGTISLLQRTTKKKIPSEWHVVGHGNKVDVIFWCISSDFLGRKWSTITHIKVDRVVEETWVRGGPLSTAETDEAFWQNPRALGFLSKSWPPVFKEPITFLISWVFFFSCNPWQLFTSSAFRLICYRKWG